MSDDGRRSPKPFEPPPWERDQFEELARRKAEEEARKAESDAAETEALEAAARAMIAAPAGDAGRPADAGEASPSKSPQAMEAARVDAMLLELSGEERSAVHEVRRAGAALAWVLAAGGSVVLGIGIVMLIRGGQKGLAGAGMVSAVGLFVIGFAVWLGYRAGRGQGS